MHKNENNRLPVFWMLNAILLIQLLYHIIILGNLVEVAKKATLVYLDSIITTM